MSIISNYSNKFSNKIGIFQNNLTESNEIDYIIGDKVYIVSNPEKIGVVTYNGVTKFSDGIWIGVALSKPLGKHNGVVQGVTYFQCEEKHGIFVRKNNLRHLDDKVGNFFELEEKAELENQLNNSNLQKRLDGDKFIVPNANVSLDNGLVLGEKVCVIRKSSNSTQKIGILRFLGLTKFSEGVWAGIELDNPVGKNDGSVDGIRYFSCKPQYGLFALENKVQKYNSSIKIISRNNNRLDSQSKYGSNETLSSIVSNFSSASRTRVRLGMTAVDSNGRSKLENKIKNTNSAFTFKEPASRSTAFQKVLKEKEQHVEQLIREREIERIDLATATAKIEELGRQLSKQISSNAEHSLHLEKRILELQESNILLNQEKEKLMEKLDEEKKKTEDLLFQIEEKKIDESDLETKTQESEHYIFELNERLVREKDLREALEKKFTEVSKTNLSNSSEGPEITSTVEVQKLKFKISQLEKELDEEKHKSKISKIIEEKDAIINDIQDRYDNLKSKLEDNLRQLKVTSNINVEIKANLSEEKMKNSNLSHDKVMLETDISTLKKVISKQNETVNSMEMKLQQYELNSTEKTTKIQHQTETTNCVLEIENEELNKENFNTSIDGRIAKEHYESEICCLKAEIEKLKKYNVNDKKSISHMESTIKNNSKELIEAKSEIDEFKRRLEESETKNVEEIRLKQSAQEEKDQICKELSAYHEQLDKLRLQISDLYNEKIQLGEVVSKNRQLERNLKQEIEDLKEKIEFLEKENLVLSDNLYTLEHKNVGNDNLNVEMSKKISDMESLIQKLNANLKSEKDSHMLLITKYATLHSELEFMRQKQDDFRNLNYEMENLQSMAANFEIEKKGLLENYELKNKELLIVRERLLKISQEFEDLQESHKNFIQKSDREKRISADKIRKLEKQLDEPDKKSQFSHSDSHSDKRRSDGKDQIASLKAANENAEEQITFLNLVISEREKKFKFLELENESLRNKVIDLENQNTTVKHKIVPPRLYCDVCEMFDSHDTDQCPVPTNGSAQSSPVTKTKQNNDKTRAPRLYCDICEVFDLHNTSDCQDEQTF